MHSEEWGKDRCSHNFITDNSMDRPFEIMPGNLNQFNLKNKKLTMRVTLHKLIQGSKVRMVYFNEMKIFQMINQSRSKAPEYF